MQSLILATPLIPLGSALVTHLSGGAIGRRVARISVGATLLAFVCALGLLWQNLAGHVPAPLVLGDGWGILRLDPLSAVMSVLISGISFLVHLYSRRYMAEEAGYPRFFVLLDLMTATLLLMVAAGDLLTLLVAWHLVGVFLYFLLGHDTRSQSSYRYAFWTLITYRFGDIPLLLAALLLHQAFGTWSMPELFARIADHPGGATVWGLPLVGTAGALIALSAFARSAQFLLHTWLPYTMDGPTPVSALMHAGIVNAGGFLMNRFVPVFVHAGDVLHWAFLVGLVTAVIGSVLMLTQNDVKKSLGYSTMGQMGFMIMEAGVGAFSLAIYHLIAHGLFKGTLFLGAGGVINEARRDDGVPKDDLYKFVVERRSARPRQPWLVMAAITLVVPVSILMLAHWLVAEDFFEKQGAVVLLFFGWVTGAQLLFTTYHMRTENIWRLVTLILVSFTVVVVGYTLVSHAFDLFLYPNPAFREDMYAAAGINLAWFDALVVLVSVVIVAGWLLAYYAQRGGSRRKVVGEVWIGFYALVSREFYVSDLYAWLTRRLLSFATRLNVLLRWS